VEGRFNMATRDEAAREQVLKLAREQDVKFIRLWFTDILGFLKSVAITVEELERAVSMAPQSRVLPGSMRAIWWPCPIPSPFACFPGGPSSMR
jgi:hypothetical protein